MEIDNYVLNMQKAYNAVSPRILMVLDPDWDDILTQELEVLIDILKDILSKELE
jgi:hypothetical protein